MIPVPEGPEGDAYLAAYLQELRAKEAAARERLRHARRQAAQCAVCPSWFPAKYRWQLLQSRRRYHRVDPVERPSVQDALAQVVGRKLAAEPRLIRWFSELPGCRRRQRCRRLIRDLAAAVQHYPDLIREILDAAGWRKGR
jgi:hypothetical protein